MGSAISIAGSTLKTLIIRLDLEESSRRTGAVYVLTVLCSWNIPFLYFPSIAEIMAFMKYLSVHWLPVEMGALGKW